MPTLETWRQKEEEEEEEEEEEQQQDEEEDEEGEQATVTLHHRSILVPTTQPSLLPLWTHSSSGQTGAAPVCHHLG